MSFGKTAYVVAEDGGLLRLSLQYYRTTRVLLQPGPLKIDVFCDKCQAIMPPQCYTADDGDTDTFHSMNLNMSSSYFMCSDMNRMC